LSTHAYPIQAVAGDYLRSAAGLVLTGGPLLAVPLPSPVVILFGCGFALFFVYGVLTGIRQFTHITLTEKGVWRPFPTGRFLDWRSLSAVKLAYYSTKLDKSGGWLHLKLEGDGRRINLDSRLRGFREIAARTAAAARANRLGLDPATAGNFEALGLELDDLSHD